MMLPDLLLSCKNVAELEAPSGFQMNFMDFSPGCKDNVHPILVEAALNLYHSDTLMSSSLLIFEHRKFCHFLISLQPLKVL